MSRAGEHVTGDWRSDAVLVVNDREQIADRLRRRYPGWEVSVADSYLSAISDRLTTKKQGDASPVCIGAVFPSKYAEKFVENVHPKLCELFKGTKVKDGVLNIQFFVEDDVFYAYDPGFRLQGEAPDIPIAHINGFDHKKMFVNYSLTGVFGEDDIDEKNDPLFRGKKACTIWVLLTAGQIPCT